MCHFVKELTLCFLRRGSEKFNLKVRICSFIKVGFCVNSLIFLFSLPELIGGLSLFRVKLAAGAAVTGLVCWGFMNWESVFDKVDGFGLMWAAMCGLAIYFPDILCNNYLLCLNSNFPCQLFRNFRSRLFFKKTFVGMFR